jgi:hypothetical protein
VRELEQEPPRPVAVAGAQRLGERRPGDADDHVAALRHVADEPAGVAISRPIDVATAITASTRTTGT